jgi:hypothetical protein
MKLNKLMMLALALGSIVPIVNSSQIAMAGSPQYQITTAFIVDRSGDGPGGNTLEVYGEIRINDVVFKSISRNNPLDRTSGGWGPIFMDGSKVVTGNTATINAVLKDKDTLSSDDIVFQMPITTIDLEATTNAPHYGKKKFQFVSPSGSEGATLYISVNKMPCMFAAAGCN